MGTIYIENVDVEGFKHAVRGMRNPMNSWDKSDSGDYILGPNDRTLMKKLIKGGPVHCKFRRMIVTYMDITAPLYWWKEFDTYKVGTVANSCSTMHKIHEKIFTHEDFAHDHLDGRFAEILNELILRLNEARVLYLDSDKKDKEMWYKMIQLLPSSYLQNRTVMLNYEVLANIYHSRKNHKLDEWHKFCETVRNLPYSWLITEEDYDMKGDNNG